MFRRFVSRVLILLALGGFSSATARCAPNDEKASASRAQRIAELEKTLANATLVGHFTVTGAEAGKLQTERYELSEVKHLGQGQWLLQARIRYGEHDLSIPLTLPIKWAGDTPVITVDNIAFPGIGSYTARVMIYRDHYAGFWTGTDHGGHLFGVLERGKEKGNQANK